MFIRQCTHNKHGRQHQSWALVESHRTAAGPRQLVVAWLGKLDEAGRLGVQQAADEDGATAPQTQLSLFDQPEEAAPVEPEAEAAFRIHQSDLKIRPIWHQKEDRVLAHIFVCFLAYVLWKTLGQLCGRAGLGSEPRRVLSEVGELRMMDVVLPTRSGVEIRKRCISNPTDHQQILLDHLNLRLPKINQTEM